MAREVDPLSFEPLKLLSFQADRRSRGSLAWVVNAGPMRSIDVSFTSGSQRTGSAVVPFTVLGG